ncbi:hypothetical protein Tco_0637549 [Tanacetum coccineum]
MANLPPNHNEFAPAAEAAPDNMNGWVEEEDPEMEEEEEDPEEDPEMEEEEEEMNADEEWDGPEWILPYQGDTYFYPSPAASYSGSSSSSVVVGHNPEDPTPNENRTRDAWRELDRATWHYHHLRRWSITVENLLPPRLQYQEPPYALPETLLAPVTHNDPRDPYIAARDAATAPATDNDDSPTQKETSPSGA